MQVACFCCFGQGVAGMSRDLGRDVPDLEKLYARKLWAATLQNKGFWGLWTENRGAPNAQMQRPRIQRPILSPLSSRITTKWGTSKQHTKLQQPRNYDFRVSQFDPLRSQSSNDRETTTSPPGHH